MVLTRLKIAQIIENLTNVKDQRTLVNDSIQMALDEVFQYHDFPYYLQDKGVIKTTNDYTTGTASVTNGSASVTGDSTVWTSAMNGRKIRFASENPYYRIKSVDSGTTMTLEQPFQGTTATGATYVLYQDEYRLNADVDKYKILRQAQNGVVLFSFHPTRFDEKFPMPQSYADPIYEILEGTQLDTYTTGTVNGNANQKTLTGASTSWDGVEGLGRMSKIRIGDNVYTVNSVDSGTQITLFEDIETNIAALSTYVIYLDNLRVQLSDIPNAQRLIYYRYFRIPSPTCNNYDIPDMPKGWGRLLVYGGLKYLFMQKGDINKLQNFAEAQFDKGLNLMKMKVGSFTPDRTYKRKPLDRFNTGIGDGLETSAFDRRYSSPR